MVFQMKQMIKVIEKVCIDFPYHVLAPSAKTVQYTLSQKIHAIQQCFTFYHRKYMQNSILEPLSRNAKCNQYYEGIQVLQLPRQCICICKTLFIYSFLKSQIDSPDLQQWYVQMIFGGQLLYMVLKLRVCVSECTNAICVSECRCLSLHTYLYTAFIERL